MDDQIHSLKIPVPLTKFLEEIDDLNFPVNSISSGFQQAGVGPSTKAHPDREITEESDITDRSVIDFSVIVPTFNEAGNIVELIRLLHTALDGIAWEVVFVDDDSPDKTAEIIKSIAQDDAHVRCIHRIGRRGLAGACIEGILSSTAPVCAVMDADLQHDETLLPEMLRAIHQGADVVIGSRYIAGGTTGEGFAAIRGWGSQLSTWLSRTLLRVNVTDPMSGFFALRRAPFEKSANSLSPDGFKILLDYLASDHSQLVVQELPFTFRSRFSGESKLDTSVTLEFLNLLASRLTNGVFSIRFMLFSLIGISGIVVHLAAQKSVLSMVPFPIAQAIGSGVAMFSNFTLNNVITFRDKRLRGIAFFRGFLSFALICSVGVIGSVVVGTWVNSPHDHWEVAWWISGLAGAVIGGLWNYSISSHVTWKR